MIFSNQILRNFNNLFFKRATINQFYFYKHYFFIIFIFFTFFTSVFSEYNKYVTNSTLFNDELIYKNATKTATFNTFKKSPNIYSQIGLTQDPRGRHSLQRDEADPNKVTVEIGYLTAVRGAVTNRQGLSISGAITLAIDDINNNSAILPNVHFKLRWNDTKGDTLLGARIMTEMLCDDVAAYFGPEISCAVEATIASAWNRSMISYRCSDASVSDKSRYPTFSRTEAPDSQIVKSVLSLLYHHNWNRFSIVVEEENDQFENIVRSLKQLSKENNMTINTISYFKSRLGKWYEMIEETKNKTRLYIFVGKKVDLVDMMGTMKSLQLLTNGEYLVIYLDTLTYANKLAFEYIWSIEEISKHSSCYEMANYDANLYRSLLVVAPSPPDQSKYDEFSKKVIYYGEKEPFNFKSTLLFKKHISIYAANLYDSFIIYSKALDNLVKKNIDPNINIQALSRDGIKIFNEITKMGQYESVTGAKISIDKNGDSEGNYTVIAFKPYNFTRVDTKNESPSIPFLLNSNTPIDSQHLNKKNNTFSCPFYMIPVALFHPRFHHKNNSDNQNQPYHLFNYPKMKIFPNIGGIDWITGKFPPSDEPKCGFNGEKCRDISSDSYLRSMITSGVLGFLLIIVIAISASLYRKWKIEQEIEGLLWKIDHDDLIFNQHLASPYFNNSTSRMSLVSVGSLGQVYCPTAQYKGALVRVKDYRFNNKKYIISRQTMKEMRYMREICHSNINSFHGAVIQPSKIILVYDYCGKGSLSDVVENEDIRLDASFIASMINDLVKGLIYLHDSDLCYHGNLKSSNCVITSRWVLQLTDFGLSELRYNSNSNVNQQSTSAIHHHHLTDYSNISNDNINNENNSEENNSSNNHNHNIHGYFQNMLWTSPELLRLNYNPTKLNNNNFNANHSNNYTTNNKFNTKNNVITMITGSQKGDLYSFGIILYEIYGRKGPYGLSEADPKDIIDNVRRGAMPSLGTYYRPDLNYLRNELDEPCPTNCPEFVINLIIECWEEFPENRPNIRTIRERLKPLKDGMPNNIMDHMMGMMEKYANNLEDLVNERTGMLIQEKKKTEDLLHRMLPMPVATKLMSGCGIEPESFDQVTIYFSDIVGFTSMSAESTPLQVVNFLNDLYTLFDSIIRGYDVYKVETIGDAYMVVSGLPLKNGDRHSGEIASMALDLLRAVKNYRIQHRPTDTLQLRIGIHTGPVCAGVVGLTMPRYCLFGDTVNTSSRMESNGEPLKIHISSECKESLDRIGGYVTQERGAVYLKGKGNVVTHWLIGTNEGAIQPSILNDDEMDDLRPLFSRPRGHGQQGGSLSTPSNHYLLSHQNSVTNEYVFPTENTKINPPFVGNFNLSRKNSKQRQNSSTSSTGMILGLNPNTSPTLIRNNSCVSKKVSPNCSSENVSRQGSFCNSNSNNSPLGVINNNNTNTNTTNSTCSNTYLKPQQPIKQKSLNLGSNITPGGSVGKGREYLRRPSFDPQQLLNFNQNLLQKQQEIENSNSNTSLNSLTDTSSLKRSPKSMLVRQDRIFPAVTNSPDKQIKNQRKIQHSTFDDEDDTMIFDNNLIKIQPPSNASSPIKSIYFNNNLNLNNNIENNNVIINNNNNTQHLTLPQIIESTNGNQTQQQQPNQKSIKFKEEEDTMNDIEGNRKNAETIELLPTSSNSNFSSAYQKRKNSLINSKKQNSFPEQNHMPIKISKLINFKKLKGQNISKSLDLLPSNNGNYSYPNSPVLINKNSIRQISVSKSRDNVELSQEIDANNDKLSNKNKSNSIKDLNRRLSKSFAELYYYQNANNNSGGGGGGESNDYESLHDDNDEILSLTIFSGEDENETGQQNKNSQQFNSEFIDLIPKNFK